MYVKFISVPDFDLCSLIFAVHFLGVANNSEFTFHTGIFLNFKNGFTCSRKQAANGTPESSVKMIFYDEKKVLGVAKAYIL